MENLSVREISTQPMNKNVFPMIQTGDNVKVSDASAEHLLPGTPFPV